MTRRSTAHWLQSATGAALALRRLEARTMTELPDFDALWNYGDPAATEAQFQALLPAAGAAPAYHAALLTQIARAQGLQRQFDAAHETLDAAERLIASNMTSARIRLLLERGRVYNSAQRK